MVREHVTRASCWFPWNRWPVDIAGSAERKGTLRVSLLFMRSLF